MTTLSQRQGITENDLDFDNVKPQTGITVKEVLDSRGMQGHESLMCIETGSVDTSENWAYDCLKSCDECDSQAFCYFSDLVEVHLINGSWEEKI